MGQKKFFANAVKVAFSFAITMMVAIMTMNPITGKPTW